jgi:protein TonB
VLAGVVALETWLAAASESAKFGGPQHVVHVEFRASAESPAAPPSSTFEPLDLPPPIDVLLLSEDTPVSLATAEFEPGPPAELTRPTLASTALKMPVRDDVESAQPRPRPVSPARPREQKPSQPETAAPRHQQPPKQAAAQSPTSLAAQVPPLAGADDETPPDFSGNRRPSYPPEAYRRGIQGEVTLRIHVAQSGHVESVEIVRSSGYVILDRAAVDAVSTWRGTPARRHGAPIASVHLLPVHFRLR